MDGSRDTLWGGFKLERINWVNGELKDTLITPCLLGENVYMPDRHELMVRCVKSIDGNNAEELLRKIKDSHKEPSWKTKQP